MADFEEENPEEDQNQQNGTKADKMQTDENKKELIDIPDFPIKFRNYTPKDESLAQYKVARPEITDIPKQIAENLKKIAAEEPDWNNISLTPKKVNWDLKRDIAKKLEKLDNRTQRAVIDMMREKLQQAEKGRSSKPEDDLAKGISVRMARDISSKEEED